jgi:pimeloyl-ACP methyl ester carboxylesterase
LADNDQTTPIRRGRGMRLSTQSPPAEEPQAPPAQPAAADEPIARGRGLRLTTAAVAAAPLERAQARVRTGLTSYLRLGEGPPLLLLHGFGASGRNWRGVMEALADRRSCIAPDLPGFGASPPRPAAPTLDALADEVLALADALGIARFDLAGHSLGAALAATIAGRNPERVGRVALTSFGVRPFAPELVALGVARPPLDLSIGLMRPLVDFWRPWSEAAMLTPPASALLGAAVLHGPPAEPALWREYLADHSAADGRAYLTSITAQGDPALQARLPAIGAPTLLIAGREDRVARLPTVQTAQALIPGARLLVIDGCGHLPMIEQPERYAAALREQFPA